MYQSLYRRYRPDRFDRVKGQALPLKVVTGALSSGRIGHAYLFSGPRGCGKTTVARLFAKALNCENRQGFEPCGVCESCRALAEGRSLDVLEIDGASNNSVDEIRELKSNIGLASFGGRWKVYIIDEVHMLSQSAFNALLKTLEEPPERVLFILATTEPFKVPATIRSRCQHLPFQGMGLNTIAQTLREVTVAEGAEGDEEVFWEIARLSDGGMRDALSLLEQVLALGGGRLDLAALEGLTGGSSHALRRWLTALWSGEPGAAGDLDALFSSGAQPERVVLTLFDLVRNLWLMNRYGPSAFARVDVSEAETQWLNRWSGTLDRSALESGMIFLAGLIAHLRRGMSTAALSGLLTLHCGALIGEGTSSEVKDSARAGGQRPLSAPSSGAEVRRFSPEAAALGSPKPVEGRNVEAPLAPLQENGELHRDRASGSGEAKAQDSQPEEPRSEERKPDGVVPEKNMPQAPAAEDFRQESAEERADEEPSVQPAPSKETDLAGLWARLEREDPFYWMLGLLAQGSFDGETYHLRLDGQAGLAWELLCSERRLEDLRYRLKTLGFKPSQLVFHRGDQTVSPADDGAPEPLSLPGQNSQKEGASQRPGAVLEERREEPAGARTPGTTGGERGKAPAVLPNPKGAPLDSRPLSSSGEGESKKELTPAMEPAPGTGTQIDDVLRLLPQGELLYYRREAEPSKEEDRE